jgi:hypothetical protein
MEQLVMILAITVAMSADGKRCVIIGNSLTGSTNGCLSGTCSGL